MDPTDSVFKHTVTYRGVKFEIEVAANAIMHVGPFTLKTPLPIRGPSYVDRGNVALMFEAWLSGLDKVIQAAADQGIDLNE